jgi:hypothetical protein
LSLLKRSSFIHSCLSQDLLFFARLVLGSPSALEETKKMMTMLILLPLIVFSVLFFSLTLSLINMSGMPLHSTELEATSVKSITLTNSHAVTVQLSILLVFFVWLASLSKRNFFGFLAC